MIGEAARVLPFLSLLLAPFRTVSAQRSAPSKHPENSVPMLAASGFTDVAAGGSHTCAVTHLGGVKCWGWNDSGQLGDGTMEDRNTPAYVSGLLSGAIATAAGQNHTCALTSSGGIRCWGDNFYGQLGDGTTEDRATPVDVAGLSSGVLEVDAGYGHTCALITGGAVRCWGNNYWGQVGNSTATDTTTPIDVFGLSGEVTDIAVGAWHTCALITTGAVKCWGYNSSGQLGDGTTDPRSWPMDVPGLSGGVTSISAGAFHTCALTSGAAVKCWGYNLRGQLGDGTTEDRSTPVDVVGASGNVVAIEAGGHHNCLQMSSGETRCWGVNANGELGDGTTIERHAPVSVTGLPGGVTGLSAGGDHTCAITPGGGLKCWGSNIYGQLGDGTAESYLPPVDVAGLSANIADLAAGRFHTCTVTAGGAVKCWGDNYDGQLGDGTTNSHSTPADVYGLSGGMTAVTAGREYTCALTAGGGVKCWGSNSSGQLGDGTTDDRTAPVDVLGLSSSIASIEAGAWHACAVIVGGAVKCWGANLWGRLGEGTMEERSTPVDVVGLSSAVTAVAPGFWHTCALTAEGTVQCWGSNWDGELGSGGSGFSPTPVDVAGLSSVVSAITAGEAHTCALLTGGAVKCWGVNSSGQLGDNTTVNRSTPVDVVGLSGQVTAIAAGSWHTCALIASGDVECWGNNYYKQLGDGTRTGRTAPVRVIGLSGSVLALEAGEAFSCAVTSGGVRCWGNNFFGQLGNGMAGYRSVPVDVITQTFEDVTSDYWAADFIEQLYVAGITGGCALNPLRYCPDATVTRDQMAVFLLRGIHTSSYMPPAVGSGTGFGDVPADHWVAAWIKQLAAEGITAGCGNGNYCPEQPVTRAQMAVFLLRSKYGENYSPPAVGAGTGFGDVPPDHWAAAWIKQLAIEGITTGCGNGNYCPEDAVTRAQMAVFLVKTFNVP